MKLINFINKERKKLVMQGHNNLSDLSYSTMLCELILLTFLSPFSINGAHFCLRGVNNYFIPIIA